MSYSNSNPGIDNMTYMENNNDTLSLVEKSRQRRLRPQLSRQGGLEAESDADDDSDKVASEVIRRKRMSMMLGAPGSRRPSTMNNRECKF